MNLKQLFATSLRSSTKQSHPFELKPQAATTSSRRWGIFGRHQANKKMKPVVETTPQTTPESSPVHHFPLFIDTSSATTVGVLIPQEYRHQRTNCVGGKNVPFTRRQVKVKQRRVRRYPTIPEEDSATIYSEA
ncbi:hypothetical protein AaE_013927 [Aphanomyces astaci]|uniref:Uncharacterized protein n=1 Tax=Aphanomyces astaci TaxID=112090 RepID=A0A6A4Z894_APHAT|nr:hypothetical protein AaE_013927 [Aphanomyces astaci]